MRDPTNTTSNRTADQPTSAEDTARRYALGAAMATVWPSTQHLLPEDLLHDIASAAPDADEQGVLSTGTIDGLRHAGYFGLPVPTEFCGGGAGLLECASVQRRLAIADPALAIAANMHLFSAAMVVEHWLRHRDACGLLLEAIATQHRIIASAFAEPGLGGALLRSNVKARRTAGGVIITGLKAPCSLAAHCDLVCFQMQADPIEPRGVMIAMIPAKSPGIRIERTWDSLGMRGSGSDTLLFEECFVPDDLVFHRSDPGFDDDEVFAAGLVWFCVTTTATYLGIVKRTIDAACHELHRAAPSAVHPPRAALPSVQGQLGELVAATMALETACAQVAVLLDSRQHDPRSLVPLAVAVKHTSIDACIRAVEGSAELVGAGSYARTGQFARPWRDIQAIRFHPPTRLVSRQLLGKWALELPFVFELDERSSSTAPAKD